MIRIVILFALVLVAAATTRAQEIPVELVRLAARLSPDGRVVAWCRAEFQDGHPGAFAVGVSSSAGGGQYVARDPDGVVTELGPFTGTADLSCCSRAEAEELDASIRQSKTIEGHVTPRWNTTVVCGFTDGTAAVCWQFSPTDRVFVVVGRWIT